MADVIGPNPHLPGNLLKVPKSVICDGDHLFPVTATRRVVGETDSFGSELIDMCEDCYQKHLKAVEDERKPGGYLHDMCEWCKTGPHPLRETRDIDEGSSGPVYLVCSACRQKQNESAREELEYYAQQEDHDDYNNLPPDDDDEYADIVHDKCEWVIHYVSHYMSPQPEDTIHLTFEHHENGRVKVVWKEQWVATITPRILADGEHFLSDERQDVELLTYPDSRFTERCTYEECAKYLDKFYDAGGVWDNVFND